MFSYFRSTVPHVNLEMDTPDKFITECVQKNGTKSDDNYLRFTQQLEDYIGADCWAIMVDGKFLFNGYWATNSYLKTI